MTGGPVGAQRKGGRGNVVQDEFDPVSYIAQYRPRTAGRWAEVEDFVRAMALLCAVHGFRRTHRILRALTRLAEFCLGTGVPLEPEDALHPDNVAHFLATAVENDGTAGAYRSELRMIGKLATRRAPWVPEQRFRRFSREVPYEDHELERLWRAVLSQSTETRRQAGTAMLLLGRNVGLDGRWVTYVGSSDILEEADGSALVAVTGERARTVPVSGTRAGELLDFNQKVATECLVGSFSTSTNRANSLVKTIKLPGDCPRLVLGRLRSRWLADHLIAGTPLPLLLDYAGLKGLHSLEPVLPFVRRYFESHPSHKAGQWPT